MAVEPGIRLLGAVVETRRRHSVASLAAASGLHPKTLNRALVQSGLMPDGDPDRVDGQLSVEAAAGERLAERLRRSIPVVRIPAYLNCNRTQAEMLVRHGLVGRIEPAESRAKTMLNMVPIDDLDAFLAKLVARGRAVDCPSPGMADFVTAAKVARWPVIDIVKAVIAGGLARIEVVRSEKGFKAVRLDPEEVRCVLERRQGRGRLSLDEAAARLGFTPAGVKALTMTCDRDGRPAVMAEICRNGNGVQRYYFEPKDLERFEADHVDFGTLAAERGITLKALGKALREARIEPVLPRVKLNKLVYRRSDL
jgi:hypothetical protein